MSLRGQAVCLQISELVSGTARIHTRSTQYQEVRQRRGEEEAK